MKFGILGSLEVTELGREVSPPAGRQRAMLALLILNVGKAVSLDTLCQALWGDDPPKHATNALQSRISQLRKLVGVERLVSHAGGYLLDIPANAVDALRFEEIAALGRQSLLRGDVAEASALLGEGLALWRGAALAEFAHEEFARAEAARLEELRLVAVDDRIRADLRLGRHVQLVGELQRLVADNPLRERFHGHLMLALYRAGRQADSLRAFGNARRMLAEELGLDPGEDLRRLEAAVLTHDPAIAAPVHAVADEPDYERTPAPHSLPGRMSTFVGRHEELVEIRKLLESWRLVTITGAGGAGKTRLAIELGTELQPNIGDGVWLVELATVADPSAVPHAVAAALGIRDHAGTLLASSTPTTHMPARDRLVEYLGDKDLLLIIDNCEHLVTAVAILVETLLSSCPRLRILATSREPLRVRGEAQWSVPPLRVPEVGESASSIVRCEAVQLFSERAAAVQSRFVLDDESAPAVALICRRLDGMPLAIELAAARVKALPINEIAERLGDRFQLLSGGTRTALPRHQTLRALVDWSYELLFEQEQTVFRRLSVFVGGVSLEAAEYVCRAAGVDGSDVVELIVHLVDKSLLTASQDSSGAARYRMLETLRQYGLEKLASDGEEDDARMRHAQWALTLAERAEPEVRGSDQRAWLVRLGTEHDNLRAALDWAIRNDHAELAQRLAGALWFFWWLRGHQREGLGWLEAALSCKRDRGLFPGARVRALTGAAHLACAEHQLGRAIAHGEEAVALSAQTGDGTGEALSRLTLAAALGRNGDDDRSRQVVEEAITAFRQRGDEWGLGASYNLLCTAAIARGDFESAETAGRESLAHHEARGNPGGVGRALWTLGLLAECRGDCQAAVALYEACLLPARALGIREVIVVMLDQLANALGQAAQPERAWDVAEESRALALWLGAVDTEAAGDGPLARRRSDLARADGLYEEALVAYRRADRPQGEAFSLAGLAYLAEVRNDHAQAGRLYRESLQARGSANAASLGRALAGMARVAIALHDLRIGVALIAAIQALGTANGWPRLPSEQMAAERACDEARGVLGQVAFDAAWAQGSAMTLAEVITATRGAPTTP